LGKGGTKKKTPPHDLVFKKKRPKGGIAAKEQSRKEWLGYIPGGGRGRKRGECEKNQKTV